MVCFYQRGGGRKGRGRQPCRPMWQGGGGVLILGGGGRCKHWPPGAGDPRYATGCGGGGRGQQYRHIWCSAISVEKKKLLASLTGFEPSK